MGVKFAVPATFLVLAAFAAETIAPETLQLARIQNKAKQGLSSIPAYTCSEVMDRSARASSRGLLQKVDQLKLEVAEIGGKELFSKPGEKNFNENGIKEYANHGLIATECFTTWRRLCLERRWRDSSSRERSESRGVARYSTT